MRMTNPRTFGALIVNGLGIALVVGCGGGGGPQLHLELVPASVDLAVQQGDSESFAVVGIVSGTVEQPVTVVVRDPVGVITTNVEISQIGEGRYEARLRTNSELPAGKHQGRIQVDLCSNASCSSRLGGSSLPYVVNVLSTENLPPLVRLADVGEWSSFQGGSAHTGYVPVTLDPQKFAVRWIWRAPGFHENQDYMSAAVTDQSRIYISVGTIGSSTPARLFALDESSSLERWRHEFFPTGGFGYVNPPATDDGAVLVTTTGQENTYFWMLDGSSGSIAAQSSFLTQWDRPGAPIVADDIVVTRGGSYGGSYAFERATGAERWFADGFFWYGESHGYDGTLLYEYQGYDLVARTPATGAEIYRLSASLPDGSTLQLFDYSAPVVLGEQGVVIAAFPSGLVRFNTATRDVTWQVAGHYSANPAVAHGMLYVGSVNPRRLEARRFQTGELVWSWEPPPTEGPCPFGSPIVTENLLFISTCAAVYAIDLEDHEPVWGYPRSGELALSPNGILYITRKNVGVNSTDEGRLTAVTLH